MKHLWLSLMMVLAGWDLPAQDLAAVSTNATADLKQALAELTTIQQQIDQESVPLGKQLRELEEKLATARREYAKAERFQENQKVEKEALKTESKQKADSVKYIDALLTDYAKNFRARMHFIEVPKYKAAFDAVEKASADPDLSPSDQLAQQLVLLTTSLKRTESTLGGEIMEGKALDKKGRIQQGKVAIIGPVAMFASAVGDQAGLIQQEVNKADPTLVTVDEDLAQGSRALVTTGKGQLGLDATLGNAFKLSALKQSLFERISKGGWVMAPLLTLGFAMLIVALFKWIQLSRIRLARESDLQKVLGHLENEEKEKALAHARGIPGPAGEMLATAVEHSDEKKEYIEEILYEKLLGTRTRLERGIAFLALTATAGPLMGLLGTVMGMIATFKLISSFGSGDPKMLASGISEALIATATGMSVAIPALLLHAFLSRKAKSVIGSMEQTAVGFVNGVPERATFS